MFVKAGFTIREYRTDDLESMFALDCACFAEVYRFSRRAMRKFAEARGALSLVAVDVEGTLVGFEIMQVERHYGYVVTLDVAPQWRRRGVASRLMAAAERNVTVKGGKAVLLHVSTENESAVRFYEKAGYERLEVEAAFYGEGLDAFVYRKLLPEG